MTNRQNVAPGTGARTPGGMSRTSLPALEPVLVPRLKNNSAAVDNGALLNPAAEREAQLRELLSEYRRVCRDDPDLAREWRLRKQIYALELQNIEEALALIERSKPGLETQLQWAEGLAAMMQPYELAVRRTDLTIPELLFLMKLKNENMEKERISLLAAKQELEQKLHPGRRRNRRAT